MEHESDERTEGDEGARAGVARSQHALYLLPQEPGAVGTFLAPALDRALAGTDETTPSEGRAPRLLVIAPDAGTAVAIAGWIARRVALEPSWHPGVLPVTSARRAGRLLGAGAFAVVTGAPRPLLELVKGAALKLDGVRGVVIAWPDAIMDDAGDLDALERILAEVPRDAPRTIVASRLAPGIETLVERYARRPRRVGPAEAVPSADAAGTVDVRYVATTQRARPDALRRVLDELDPSTGAIFAASDSGASEVADTLRALGYVGGTASVRCTRGERVDGAGLIVLYELPATRDALRTLAVPGAAVVALVSPRQLPALQALAGDGRVAPVVFSEPAAAARAQEDRLRDELRGVLRDAFPARELLAVEPLLEEYDGATIAAAALRLLDRERGRRREVEPAAAAPPAAPVRIFINAGARDGVAARDLMGAIANETGVPGDRIGRIEVRENHSVVEVPAAAADQVCTRLTGVVLRGRRLLARVDRDQRERPQRGAEPRAARPRPPRPSRPPHPSGE